MVDVSNEVRAGPGCGAGLARLPQVLTEVAWWLLLYNQGAWQGLRPWLQVGLCCLLLGIEGS